MALWAAVIAFAVGFLVIISMTPDSVGFLQGVLGLAAIIGLFALVCAYDARHL